MFCLVDDTEPRPPWNKGKPIRQKKPRKLKETWTIRVRVPIAGDVRGLALFNLALDSKLRANAGWVGAATGRSLAASA